jgi:hypothetical protein
VALRTVWDSTRDADEFRRSVELWIDEADVTASVRPGSGAEVWVFFATDDEALVAVSASL